MTYQPKIEDLSELFTDFSRAYEQRYPELMQRLRAQGLVPIGGNRWRKTLQGQFSAGERQWTWSALFAGKGAPVLTDGTARGFEASLLGWLNKGLDEPAAIRAIEREVSRVWTRGQALHPDIASLLETRLRDCLRRNENVRELPQLIAREFKLWEEQSEDERRVMAAASAVNIVTYHEVFLEARRLNRRFHLILGPTGSGKSRLALEALAGARSGCYLAPLRLVAEEGQVALEARGVPTSLVTGEFQVIRPNATHVAATCEMANFSRVVDVAVIDEAQLIADAARGWSWTAAICGVPANDVYLVGSDDIEPLVLPLLKMLGVTYDITRLERLVELEAPGKAVTLDKLPAKTAVIAVSRRNVLKLRDELVGKGYRVAVVYGSLAPKVRRAEAARYRAGDAQIVVGTDAIGMGLNLPIDLLVFSAVEKYDGSEMRELTVYEYQQIAGRAGRYGMSEKGVATALTDYAAKRVQTALAQPAPARTLSSYFVAPSAHYLEQMSRTLDTDSLETLLQVFKTRIAPAGSVYSPVVLDDSLEKARWVGQMDLPLDTRFEYSNAPLDNRDELAAATFIRWARRHEKGGTNAAPRFPRTTDLEELEGYSKLLALYCWFGYRFPETYPDLDAAQDAYDAINHQIEQVLVVQASQKSRKRQSVL